MNWKFAVAIAAMSLIVGCNHSASDGISSDQITATESPSDDNPFAGDPFADIDWNSIEWGESESIDLNKTVDFQFGDLVPCPDELVEYVLQINAMSGGDCFYRRRQSFCRYDGKNTDPSGQRGMQRENLVCALLANGFARGSYEYANLLPESVTVKIEWDVSQEDDSQRFVAEFALTSNNSGSVDAGDGNTFEWSLLRSK